MQRKLRIGLLFFLIIFILLFVFVYKISYHIALTEIQEEKREHYEALDDFYWIEEEDGLVVVCYADKETVFDMTSISVKDLPITVQMEIDNGIRVNSLKQVYGFLENYSS